MLDCVRLHPSVGSELHDPAIADFLLFGLNLDPATTAFRAIRKLPPAHAITWTDGRAFIRRYWRLPIEEPLHFARSDEYPERFRELLGAALRDRLRAPRVGILMSGGLDSTTLAAAAQAILREDGADGAVHAIASVYDRLVPDDERHYAAVAARHLHIPIRFDVRDDETSILEWDRVSIHTPEPVENPPACAAAQAFYRSAAAETRVLLYGEGPDNALHYEWRAYLKHLLGRRAFGRLIRDASADLLWHRRVPLWSSVRRLVRWTPIEQEAYPAWLAADFEARASCRERWESCRSVQPGIHPVRPKAYDGLDHPRWQHLFESCDWHAASSGVEILHPFLDLRVLRFMLSVPAIPWCRDKLLIRRAMRNALPGEVLRRKKTALPANPDFERVRTAGLRRLEPQPELDRYVVAARVPQAPRSGTELRSALRAHGLSHWLQHLDVSFAGEYR